MSRLNEYNVKIKQDKCKFFCDSVKFLGHIVSESGIKPCPEKVEAILKAPAPKNLTELQALLGILNYYGRFIPNLSTELKDLYKLLGKNVKYEWSEVCEKSFNRVKQLINQNNILELYDPNKPIVVAADASPYGVGAILSHLVNGVEKPVLFASSTLSEAEKNYSQIHREALAVIFAVKKFNKYIYGHKFTLCSDSEALKEIFNPHKGTSQVAASRLQRWAVILSIYDYTFEHRPSKKMTHVDC